MTPLCTCTGLVGWYQMKDDYFLGQIIAMDEIWARSYEPNLKCLSNEWKHPGSPHPKKMRPTQCSVKLIFIAVYEIDGVILHHTIPPRHMVNAAKYCTFLHHHLRPGSGEMTTLGGTEPHHSS